MLFAGEVVTGGRVGGASVEVGAGAGVDEGAEAGDVVGFCSAFVLFWAAGFGLSVKLDF